MSGPIRVYLDQSAYSQFLNQRPDNWRKAQIAEVLLREQAKNTALVWASPTNVLETLQSKDRRRELSAIMLALTSAKRMWGGSDFERVRDFLGFFDTQAPGFWRQKEFYRHRLMESRRNWIGALALLACPEELALEGIINTALRNKTISQLLHARFAADPDKFVAYVQKTISGMEVTKEDPFANIEKMSTGDMQSEINSLAPTFQKLSKQALKRLNDNREDWAGAYGAIEIGRLLGIIFDLPLELVFMVNVVPVVQRWEEIKKKLNWNRSLPKEIATAEPKTLLSDIDVIQKVLQEMVFAATKAPLISSRVGYEVIFRDLQICINQKTIPTGGLAFDADHSVAVCCFHIILSNDEKLVGSLKTLSKEIAERSNGKLQPSIASTAKELEEALKAQTSLATKTEPHEEEAF